MDTTNDQNEEDIEIIEEDVLAQLKKTKEKLKEANREKADYLAGWQRAKADFINARKDEERMREHMVKFAGEALIKELLPLADSFEMALRHEQSESMALLLRQLLEILKHNGVVPYESIGKPFNPQEHEALGEIAVDEEEKNNIILEELQKGYMMHERVLRPAKVKIGIYQ